MLFKTATCPNCKIAMAKLQKAGIEYEAIDAYENEELCELYFVRQAPTLVVLSGESNMVEKYSGVGEITRFIDNNT